MKQQRTFKALIVPAGVLLLTALALSGAVAPRWPAPRADSRPPTSTSPHVVRAGKPVGGEYIVIFRDDRVTDAAALADELMRAEGGEVVHLYEHAVKGFDGRMTECAASELSRDPRVLTVQENGVIEPSGVQANPPNWGLDRIDQRNAPPDYSYSYGTTGLGVNAYVIDTGLNFARPDFAGRAVFDAEFATEPTGGWDCNGHGTAVAGILGGTRYGVAKQVTLHVIRVSGSTYYQDYDKDDGRCVGSFNAGQVVAALDWVTAHHVKPAVVNLSWELEPAPAGNNSFDLSAVDLAAKSLIRAGVTLVNSAGNDNDDASASHPTCLPEVLVVGAVTSSDYRYWNGVGMAPAPESGSNYGYAVDIHAPGVSIKAPDAIRDEAEWTGTSFAAPHVAGAVARYLQTNPYATPAQVENYIISTATLNKVKGLPGPQPFYSTTPNRLLYIQP
jgi:subtilisin family serine protease